MKIELNILMIQTISPINYRAVVAKNPVIIFRHIGKGIKCYYPTYERFGILIYKTKKSNFMSRFNDFPPFCPKDTFR